MQIVSKNEMYAIDKFSIENLSISAQTLMENAGSGSANYIKNKILKNNLAAKVAVVCSHGNNGGDGFVVARLLKEFGFYVDTFFIGDKTKFSPETKNSFNECIENYIKVRTTVTNGFIDYDLVVDAIFGIGVKGNIKPPFSNIIKIINSTAKKVVALDIPSGLNVANGESDLCIKAHYTLTMAAYKYGHFLGLGKYYCGKTKIIDIGIPKKVYKKLPPKIILANYDNVLLPTRNICAHKTDYGKAAIIAGSKELSGAAILASKACLHSGAGLIYLYHPQGLDDIYSSSLTEVITNSISDYPKDIDKDILTKDVLLIGPGLTAKKDRLLKYFLKNWGDKPLIIDADAINILANNLKLLNSLRNKNVLLTPHIGEFARLNNITNNELIANIIEVLQMFVARYKINILLKSSSSIFMNQDKTVIIKNGNDGLATGGSGDVLAGIITAFSAQGLTLADAAISGAYILGTTAESLAKKYHTNAITPTRIIDNIFKI